MRRDEKQENGPKDENNKCNKMKGDEQLKKSIQWRNRIIQKMLTEEATIERRTEEVEIRDERETWMQIQKRQIDR